MESVVVVSRGKMTAASIVAALVCFWGFGVVSSPASECVKCHTNPQRLKEITEFLAQRRPSAEELKSLSRGPSMAGTPKPLPADQRLLIDKKMFDDENHGDMSCEDCHRGNPNTSDWRMAHGGLKRDPSFPAPGICAECHEEEAKNYAQSLHHSIQPMKLALKTRAGQDPAERAQVELGFDYHCLSCHSSCGHCHVSRPPSGGGGLIDGHAYLKNPSMEETCLACHGGTVGAEYLGRLEGLPADVHRQEGEMGCLDCHPLEEMHGDGQVYASRLEVKSGPTCLDCHEDIYAEGAENLAVHRDHKDKASCQVCHAQAYMNCAGCHVGRTKEGLKFYDLKAHKVGFFIGRNPQKSPKHPQKFVTVREAPVAPDTFKFYTHGDLPDFDVAPTFKLAAPHTIRRKTVQNSACNNCHGNQRLFLKGSDMAPEVRKANRKVMAIGNIVPVKVRESAPAGE